MLELHTKLTSQGQVSVPAAIRQVLALTPGSALVWRHNEGRITVERAVRHNSLDVHRALFGDVSPDVSPVTTPKSLVELKQGIRDHMKKRYARD
jgi:antitoxin PrlF